MTIAQELEQAQAELIAAKTEADNKAKELETAKATIADLEAKLTAEKTASDAKALKLQASVDALTGNLKSEADAHGLTKAELAEANKRLSDPGYKTASSKGDDASVPEGGQAVNQTATRESLEAEYSKIPGDTIDGAKKRAEFREKHKAALGL